MQYCYIFITLWITIPSLAMQHSSQIYSPSADKNLCSVVCSKDKIFIAGDDGVHVYNIHTKTISTLSEKPTIHMAIHPRSMNVSISNETELAVYNTSTEEKKWSTQAPLHLWNTTPITFSSTDDTVYSYKKGLFTIYSSKKIPFKTFNVPLGKKPAYCVQIACHPHKKEFLYPSNEQTVSIVKPNRFREIKEIITSEQSSYIFSALYNHDASIIAMLDTHGTCCLYNTANYSIDLLQHESSTSTFSNYYISMAFHPHKNILALLTDNQTIQYWNYKTKQLIAITKNYLPKAHHEYSDIISFSRNKRLDFSPDGNLLAVAFPHACYQLEGVSLFDRFVLLFFILKRRELPRDVIDIILRIILQLELQYFNFFELLKI